MGKTVSTTQVLMRKASFTISFQQQEAVSHSISKVSLKGQQPNAIFLGTDNGILIPYLPLAGLDTFIALNGTAFSITHSTSYLLSTFYSRCTKVNMKHSFLRYQSSRLAASSMLSFAILCYLLFRLQLSPYPMIPTGIF